MNCYLLVIIHGYHISYYGMVAGIYKTLTVDSGNCICALLILSYARFELNLNAVSDCCCREAELNSL